MINKIGLLLTICMIIIAIFCSINRVNALSISTPAAVSAIYAYIPNWGSDNVSVINTATNSVVASINVGSCPRGVAINSAGTRVYITNQGSDTVSVIDTATNTVTAMIKVGSSPFGIAVNPSGTRAYVTNEGNSTVSVVDTTTNSVIAVVNVGNNPEGVVLTPDGTKAYITNQFNRTAGSDYASDLAYSNSISVIDTATNSVTATIKVGAWPYCVAINPSGTKAYVTNVGSNNLSVIDIATNTVVDTFYVGEGPWGIALTPDGTKAYVTNDINVSVIDLTTNRVSAFLNLGIGYWGVEVTPDGTRAYITNMDHGYVSVIDTATNHVITTINVGSQPYAVGQFLSRSAIIENMAPNTISDMPSPTVIAKVTPVDTPVNNRRFCASSLILPLVLCGTIILGRTARRKNR